MGTHPGGQTLVHIYTAATLASVPLFAGLAGVGARRVDASPMGAGARVMAFVNILAVALPHHDITPVTCTVVGALRVGALPSAAHSWLLTLIHILALWQHP